MEKGGVECIIVCKRLGMALLADVVRLGEGIDPCYNSARDSTGGI